MIKLLFVVCFTIGILGAIYILGALGANTSLKYNKHVIEGVITEVGGCANIWCGIKVKMNDGSIEIGEVAGSAVIDQIVYNHCYTNKDNKDNKVICEDFYRTYIKPEYLIRED